MAYLQDRPLILYWWGSESQHHRQLATSMFIPVLLLLILANAILLVAVVQCIAGVSCSLECYKDAMPRIALLKLQHLQL